MRSMLTLEERSLFKDHTRLLQATHRDNASSPTVLNSEHQNRQKKTQRFNTSSNRGGGRNHRGRGGRGGSRQVQWWIHTRPEFLGWVLLVDGTIFSIATATWVAAFSLKSIACLAHSPAKPKY